MRDARIGRRADNKAATDEQRARFLLDSSAMAQLVPARTLEAAHVWPRVTPSQVSSRASNDAGPHGTYRFAEAPAWFASDAFAGIRDGSRLDAVCLRSGPRRKQPPAGG